MIISLISALYLLNIVSSKTAYTFLYISGALLIAGEIAFTTYGLVGANGLLALYIAYVIHTNSSMFGLPFDWQLVFGLAFVEMLALLAVIVITIRFRNIRASTGTEAMIGQQAQIIEWSGNTGIVLAFGENWKAESAQPVTLQKDQRVTIKAVEGLTLKISV